MTILMLIGTVFVIIPEMFHRRISINLMLLLLLVNFVNGFRLELMYIWVVLVHHTRSNDSRSNDAGFIHKLYINYIFLWMS